MASNLTGRAYPELRAPSAGTTDRESTAPKQIKRSGSLAEAFEELNAEVTMMEEVRFWNRLLRRVVRLA